MSQQITIEQVNLLDLPSMPLADKNNFPPVPCVYFVVKPESHVVYVGRTTSLKIRWLNHHRYEEIQAIQNVSVAWFEVADTEALPEIERMFINHFNPQLNGKTTPIIIQKSDIPSPEYVYMNAEHLRQIEESIRSMPVIDVTNTIRETKSVLVELKNKYIALEQENSKLKDTIKELTAIINNLID